MAALAAAFALALPGVASAAQRYAGPSGSGTACTPAAPCGFREAVNNAAGGDEVIVLPGDHGSAAAPITGGVFTSLTVEIHGQSGSARPRVFLSAFGLRLVGASTTVSDLELRHVDPALGLALELANGAAAARVLASSLNASACRLTGSVSITDSVCRAGTNASGVSMAQGTPATATMRNVTAIGGGTGNGIFVGASAPVTLNATNVIARGEGGGADVATSASPGQTVTIALDHSNFATRKMTGVERRSSPLPRPTPIRPRRPCSRMPRRAISTSCLAPPRSTRGRLRLSVRSISTASRARLARHLTSAPTSSLTARRS